MQPQRGDAFAPQPVGGPQGQVVVAGVVSLAACEQLGDEAREVESQVFLAGDRRARGEPQRGELRGHLLRGRVHEVHLRGEVHFGERLCGEHRGGDLRTQRFDAVEGLDLQGDLHPFAHRVTLLQVVAAPADRGGRIDQDHVVAVVGRVVDFEREAHLAPQVFGVAEREDVFPGGFHFADEARLGDFATLGVGAGEAPADRLRSLVRQEAAFAVVREAERRYPARFHGFGVEGFGGAEVGAEVGAEIPADGFVEAYLDE